MGIDRRLVPRLKELFVIASEVIVAAEEAEEDLPSKIAAAMPDEDLRNEFLRRAEAYILDAIFFRYAGEPCYLFSECWVNQPTAVRQMLQAGFSPMEARRIVVTAPFDETSLNDQQRMIIQSVIEGLALREEKPQEKPQSEPAANRRDEVSGDMSVSDVAKILRISRSSVVSNIVSGKLRGYRADAPGSKRATWRISQAALEEFRTAKEPKKQEPASRRKTASKPDVIEFY